MGELEMGMPHEVHHDERVEQEIDIQAEYREFDWIERQEAPYPLGYSWNEPVPLASGLGSRAG
jgi:hypothetical protein